MAHKTFTAAGPVTANTRPVAVAAGRPPAGTVIAARPGAAPSGVKVVLRGDREMSDPGD